MVDGEVNNRTHFKVVKGAWKRDGRIPEVSAGIITGAYTYAEEHPDECEEELREALSARL